MKGVLLESLSWLEAEQVLARRPLVLLPVGARTKEHGPHLPLNNDWLIAEYLARRVAERCPVVVLPTAQYGYYPAFRDYPGSVSLRLEVFRDAIVDICQSLHRHGAAYFYVLNTGLSTTRSLAPARALLEHQGIEMDYTDPPVAYAELRHQVETQPAGTHADEIETSMMLYIAPEVVRMEHAVPDVHEPRGPGGLSRDPEAKEGVYSPTGSYGDPTRATAEKGRIVVEGMVSYLVDHVARRIEELGLAKDVSLGSA